MKAQAEIGKVKYPYIVELCSPPGELAHPAGCIWSPVISNLFHPAFSTIKAAKRVAVSRYSACRKEWHVRIRDTRDGSVRWIKWAKGW